MPRWLEQGWSELRILHVTSLTQFGGIETYMALLLQSLAEAGHDSVLVFTGDAEAASRAPAVQRHHVPDLHALDRERALVTASCMASILDSAHANVALLHTRMSEEAATTIMQRVPTAYFAHEYSSCCPAGGLYFRYPSRVCDVPLAPNHRCLVNAYVHGCNTRRPNRLASTYIATASLKHWLLRVPLILCASSFVAERHAIAGYSRARLEVNPYPVVAPTAASPPPGSPYATVLYAGRLVESKGVQTLIDALPMMESRARLVISGSGPYLPELQRRVAKLGATDRVTFRSPSYGDDLADVYRASNVVVVPSLWPEPFGLVGPEAMAHSRPVVASDIGGIPEWLAPGTGVLVPPGDPVRLASAVNDVLSEPHAAATMGARGRNHVIAHFSMDSHLSRLLSALRHLKEQQC